MLLCNISITDRAGTLSFTVHKTSFHFDILKCEQSEIKCSKKKKKVFQNMSLLAKKNKMMSSTQRYPVYCHRGVTLTLNSPNTHI